MYIEKRNHSNHTFNGSDTGDMIDFRQLINGTPSIYAIACGSIDDDGIVLNIPIKDPDDKSRNLNLYIKVNLLFGWEIELTDIKTNEATKCRVFVNCDEIENYITNELFHYCDEYLCSECHSGWFLGSLYCVLGALRKMPDYCAKGIPLDEDIKSNIIKAIQIGTAIHEPKNDYTYYDQREILSRTVFGDKFVDTLNIPKHRECVYAPDENGILNHIGYVVFDYHFEPI